MVENTHFVPVLKLVIVFVARSVKCKGVSVSKTMQRFRQVLQNLTFDILCIESLQSRVVPKKILPYRESKNFVFAKSSASSRTNSSNKKPIPVKKEIESIARLNYQFGPFRKIRSLNFSKEDARNMSPTPLCLLPRVSLQ
jgi:hypothetical protein